MRKLICCALLITFATTPAVAQDDPDYVSYESDRFQLWTDCEPVYLVVEGLRQDGIDIGLTVESLKTLVRSRLRSARIYSTHVQPHNYLYLNVTVVGSAFSYTIEFNKIVTDNIYSGFSKTATVWGKGGTGISAGNAGYIRQAISGGVDVFIDEYLRVNAESCGGPQVPN